MSRYSFLFHISVLCGCLHISNDLPEAGAESTGVDANGNSYDFTTKLLHLAWHPTENSLACAAANSLYMYNAC